MTSLISFSSAASGCGRRPRRCRVVPGAAWTTRLERAIPSTPATRVTACHPTGRARPATIVFLLRQIQRLAQDLVLQGFLAEQPAQLANLLLQGPVLGGR